MPDSAPLQPLNGTRTHPLSKNALKELSLLALEVKPRQEVNPGVVNRLMRENLARRIDIDSPYRTRRGKVDGLEITEAGRAVLAAARNPQSLQDGGNPESASSSVLARYVESLGKDCLDGWTLFGCWQGQWTARRLCTTGDNAKAKCRAQLWPGCRSNLHDRYDLFVIFDPAHRAWMYSDPLWSPTRVVWKRTP